VTVRFHESSVPLLVPWDSVKPWPDNPRSGDLTALKESIRVNGFYGSIIVQQSTKFIIAGNHRHQALGELGATEVPVLELDVDTSDVEAVRIALADNRASDLAFYDDEALFKLLEQLIESEGLEGTGYDRTAYELLLQGHEASDIVGGVRQGVTPDDRLDQYNQLDIRSIILPYEAETYEEVANKLAALRQAMFLESNADVVKFLVDGAFKASRLEESEDADVLGFPAVPDDATL